MYHETNKPEDPYKCVHEIRLDVAGDFKNWSNYTNKQVLRVNSRHHQAVDGRFLSNEFAVIGRHINDGTIEMIAHKTLPISAVQFHPEDIDDYDTNIFINNIIDELIITRKSIL